MMRNHHLVVAACLMLAGVVGLATGAAALDTAQLNAKVHDALMAFDENVSNAEEIKAEAKGVLVCPDITKVGLGVGLERGACSMIVDGKPVEYWQASSASFGLTAGIQSMTQLMVFMDQETLDKFRASDRGWEAGVDGSVAIAQKGAGTALTVDGLTSPIVLIAYGQKGLMGDLSVEGSTYKKVGDATAVDASGVPIHRFVATADVGDRAQRGAQTVRMTIDIDCWITEADRTQLRNVLRDEGHDAFQTAVAEMPSCGTVKQPGQNTAIHYAYSQKLDDDRTWRVILGTTDPMGAGWTRQVARADDDSVTIIQFDVDTEHMTGEGVMQMGPKYNFDPDKNTVTIVEGNTRPVKMTLSYNEIE